MIQNKKVGVLFVCLGNICRSPTAHGVFQKKVDEQGLSHLFDIDSAGTAAWHVGASPDSRSAAQASKRGYDLSVLRGRQAVSDDFKKYDYILAMDNENLENLKSIAPANSTSTLQLFLDFGSDKSVSQVPDPYSGGESGFAYVLDLVEDACDNLLKHIKTTHL